MESRDREVSKAVREAAGVGGVLVEVGESRKEAKSGNWKRARPRLAEEVQRGRRRAVVEDILGREDGLEAELRWISGGDKT